MSDDEINVAVAEACGWLVSDYANDLNAMHEAVCSLHSADRGCWALELKKLVRGIDIDGEPFLDSVANATARQRAEAFLRTLGKWPDDAARKDRP
ncbi:MAG TPA: hypothetical protein VFU31_20930 [Candidatus Binatia bacterium]|nr:hypothetical protein [Candidatus Binatia bacterium]